MRIAIEIFAAVNLCMDAVSLLAAARLTSPARVRYTRVLLAALVGTAYAFVHAGMGLRGPLAAVSFFAAAYIMAAIAIPAENSRMRLRAAAVFLACSLLTGGACAALQQWLKGAFAALLCGGCAAAALLSALRQARRSAAPSGAATLECLYGGRRARMRALVDTGNRLCDPLTGLPVIAAPPQALGALLPPGIEPGDPGTMPAGFRLLRAQTAAGPCLLMCFHPQQICVEYEGRCFEADALIAVSAASEGALALMPSELLEKPCVQSAARGVQS